MTSRRAFLESLAGSVVAVSLPKSAAKEPTVHPHNIKKFIALSRPNGDLFTISDLELIIGVNLGSIGERDKMRGLPDDKFWKLLGAAQKMESSSMPLERAPILA